MNDRLIYATILHNESDRPLKWLHGYEEGDPLKEVYDLPLAVDSEIAALEVAFTLFNVDDTEHLGQIDPALGVMYEEHVTEYRARRNRSLSVGDVIILVELLNGGENEHHTAWKCMAMGWEQLDQVPEYDDSEPLL